MGSVEPFPEVFCMTIKPDLEPSGHTVGEHWVIAGRGRSMWWALVLVLLVAAVEFGRREAGVLGALAGAGICILLAIPLQGLLIRLYDILWRWRRQR